MDTLHVLLIVIVVLAVLLLVVRRSRGGPGKEHSLRFTWRVGGTPGAEPPATGEPGAETTHAYSAGHPIVISDPASLGFGTGTTMPDVQVRSGFAQKMLGDLFFPGLQAKVGDVQKHTDLGAALAQQKKWDDAVVQFSRAVASAHQSLYSPGRKLGFEGMIAAGAHNNLGNALVGKGDLRRAVVEFREGIRLYPDLALLHDSLGHALVAMGDVEGSTAELREAIRLDPKLAEMHKNLGDTLAASGNLDGAILEYQRALRLDPELASAQDGLGRVGGKEK
jgi:Tetratricopeptide repeat